jgi:Ca2+-transporting ATPase
MVSASSTTTRSSGLTSAEAERRLAALGPNALESKTAPHAWAILFAQLKGVMTWLLLGASVLSFALGEHADGVVILTIVVLNIGIGFFQEYRAERAIIALRQMSAPHARVLRDGHVHDVEARHVVPDDVLVLEAGDVIAADATLLVAHGLTTNEAALTGESLPVEKRVGTHAENAPLAEQRDRVFMGTAVVAGSARAHVTATGMRTELGLIATMLDEAEETQTPLTRHLERVGRLLVALCLAIVIVIAGIGLVGGRPVLEVLMLAVTLAVAAVPEGLTAIITIALALGVQRMVSRHVLVRRLPSVETLGCASVICTDKTGTLTTGVMEVREVFGDDTHAVLFGASACSDAELSTVTGDPTELAILRHALSVGIERGSIEAAHPRVHVNPFDAERKRMSILRDDGVLYVKGALELLAPLCEGDVEAARKKEREMALRGLRVLAVATGRGEREEELTLTGLIGLADPPRSEAIVAVKAARDAGITTVMITGDHAVTARAIAEELGIVAPGEDASELVHARATPKDKLEIVRAWKQKGAVVAMTGDGVNDAPALKEAHIGIAMGLTGTEVTREAADMVLTDDNFASIIAAVREGRGIFDNIQKTLLYLLPGNAGELLLMFVAIAMGLPIPLTPLQILWVNLITESFPALALITAPVTDDVMTRAPRPPEMPILGRREWTSILLTAVLEASVVLAVYVVTLDARGVDDARNLAFLTLVCAEVSRVFAARSRALTFFEVGVFTHVPLLVIIGGCIAAQVLLFSVPLIGDIFAVQPLSFSRDGWVFAAALIPVSVLEMKKLIFAALRRRTRRKEGENA